MPTDASIRPPHEGALFPATQVAGAFDCLRIALAVFDADDVLVYANEHFRYLYRSFDTVKELVGLSYERILRLIVSNGEIAGELAVADPEAWVQQRLAERRAREVRPAEQRLTDGRWLQIKERPTRDGGVVTLWVDVTDVVRHRYRLEDAIDSATDGFALWNQGDRLVACNDRFTRIFGSAEQPLLPGMAYVQVLRRAEGRSKLAIGPEPEAWVADRLAAHRQPVSRREVQRADGRWLQWTECRTRDGGIATVLHDVTALKCTEEEIEHRGHQLEMAYVKTQEQAARLAHIGEALDAARRETARANATKTTFMRSVTHELRTPLNAVIGFSEFLSAQALGPIGNARYVEYAALIRSSGQHLLALIDQLLELSRIEAGKLQLKHTALDVPGLLAEAARGLESEAHRAGLDLHIEAPAVLPPVAADARAVRQVLLNLVGNAIKFTQAGGTVRLSARAAGTHVAVIVADTGCGMDPEDLPYFLEPFAQTGDGLVRRAEGVGLGLATAKSLVELLGGSIAFDSAPGKGTTVTFTLPLFRAKAA